MSIYSPVSRALKQVAGRHVQRLDVQMGRVGNDDEGRGNKIPQRGSFAERRVDELPQQGKEGERLGSLNERRGRVIGRRFLDVAPRAACVPTSFER
ncbi:MAG: hypothetical protein QY328_04070 [Anaerolineales bacterium]|nr:MAG: hypothetical protein QY328_04070 [Anaerolineales bacterium]